ncbi:MAG: hypothetical protein L7F77_13640 [Candidatus Magnetominusculus sp. LBB02]|nr:hypothetical protein [Candidatus Magnetominusculus sp. LBB02]
MGKETDGFAEVLKHALAAMNNNEGVQNDQDVADAFKGMLVDNTKEIEAVVKRDPLMVDPQQEQALDEARLFLDHADHTKLVGRLKAVKSLKELKNILDGENSGMGYDDEVNHIG